MQPGKPSINVFTVYVAPGDTVKTQIKTADAQNWVTINSRTAPDGNIIHTGSGTNHINANSSTSNLSNTHADDGLYATINSGVGVAHSLIFKFDLSSLPTDIDIDGIEIIIDRNATLDLSGYYSSVSLCKKGLNLGAEKFGSQWLPVDTWVEETFGSSTDLWNQTWTREELVEDNFGLVWQVDGLTGGIGKINYVKIKIYYTSTGSPAGSPPTGIVSAFPNSSYQVVVAQRWISAADGASTPDDGIYANSNCTTEVMQNGILRIGFGISGEIGAGSVITGLQLRIKRHCSATNEMNDHVLMLSNTEIYGSEANHFTDNKASGTKWPTTSTFATYGGESDLWGGSTLTGSDLGANMYAYIRPESTSTTTSAYIDYIELTIWVETVNLADDINSDLSGKVIGATKITTIYGGLVFAGIDLGEVDACQPDISVTEFQNYNETTASTVSGTSITTGSCCSAAQGVHAMTTANLPGTLSGDVFTTTVSPGSPEWEIDDVALPIGRYILLKNQTVGLQNGIYKRTADATYITLTRSGSLTQGKAAIATGGTVHGGDSYVITSYEPVFRNESNIIYEAGSCAVTGAVGGLPGPTGATGATGAAGSDGVDGADGTDGLGVPAGGTTAQVLSKIDATDNNTEWRNTHEVPAGGSPLTVLTKTTGTDYDYDWAATGTGSGDITWRGYWETGILYNDGDIVSHNASSFVCNIEHTSSVDDEPDKEFDANPGGFEWSLLSSGPSEEEQGLLDDITDGIFDWVGDISNWGYEDVLLALAAGAGLIWVGSEVVDMFTFEDPGDANSNYNGDAVYTGAESPPTLQAVVQKICDHAEITNYDVTALPTTAVHLMFTSLTSARSALDILSKIYFFDMVDSSGTLKFLPRADQTSVRTLTEVNDLSWNKSSTATSPVMIKRYQGIDLPRTIQIEYISAANAYNKMVQEARLETFDVGQDSVITLPVTLTEDEAYNIAEKLLVNSHIERTSYSFTTSYEHIDLEPGDIITVENVGDVRILRIDEDGSEGLLNFQCVDASFNAENYTASGQASSAPPVYDDTPVVIGYSAGLTVELPPLDGTDIEQRLSIAPHGYGAAGWPGCAIYASTDGGVSYQQVASTAKEATWGKVAIATATATDFHVWDETTTITVELKTGSLSSYPEIDVYNHTNWALIGEEVIGFKNATLIGSPPNTYELTGLLRGRRGTNTTMSHSNDEAFILLDEAIVELPYPIDFKEKIYFLKFVTNGSDISKATAYTAQPSQKSRRPWTVMDLDGINAGSPGNDWLFTWLGKNQFNSEMADSGTVTQPNGFGGFVITVLDQSGSPEVVKRSVVTQSTNWTYTEAMQTADWGSVQANITIRIAQIDRLMGPGYNLTQTF